MERRWIVMPIKAFDPFEDDVIVVGMKTRGEYYVDVVPEYYERLELGTYPTFAEAYKAATHEVRCLERVVGFGNTVESFYGLDHV